MTAYFPGVGRDSSCGAQLPPEHRHRFTGAFEKFPRIAGRWRTPAFIRARFLFGFANLDLRHSVIPQKTITVQLSGLGGNFSLVLPPGIEVVDRSRKLLLCAVVPGGESPPPADPAMPTIVIKTRGVMLATQVTYAQPEEVLDKEFLGIFATPVDPRYPYDSEADCTTWWKKLASLTSLTWWP